MVTSAVTLDTERPARRLHAGALLQRLVGVGAGLYAVFLIVYLVLRLALADSQWWLALLHNFAPFYFAPLLILLPLLWLLRMPRTALRLLPLLLIGLWLYGPRVLCRNRRWLPVSRR